MIDKFLINLSGHPLNTDTIGILSSVYEEIIQVKSVNFDFSSSIEEQLDELIKEFNYLLDGSNSITIIPPGQSTLSILMTVYLHGIMGHFPDICYLEIDEFSGAYLPKTAFSINSNKVRSAGRKFRTKLF